MRSKLESLYTDLAEYFVFDKQKYSIEEFFGDIKMFKDQFKEAFEKIKETRETNARAQRAKAAREKSIKVQLIIAETTWKKSKKFFILSGEAGEKLQQDEDGGGCDGGQGVWGDGLHDGVAQDWNCILIKNWQEEERREESFRYE